MLRVLALFAVLGMLLAPFLPAQRLYYCAMDQQLHAACCCPAATPCASRGGHAGGGSAGCCTLVVIRQFMAPGQDQTPALAASHGAPGVDIPPAPLVQVLSWIEPVQRILSAASTPPPDPLFVRHCRWLT